MSWEDFSFAEGQAGVAPGFECQNAAKVLEMCGRRLSDKTNHTEDWRGPTQDVRDCLCASSANNVWSVKTIMPSSSSNVEEYIAAIFCSALCLCVVFCPLL